jgi:hypothetical protein
MIYQFPTNNRKARPKLEKAQVEDKAPEEPMGLIQGQVPDSKEEWWIAKALNRIGVSYTYQYPVSGGRTRGGYLVDFVVNTTPLATMIEPIGNHWHTGELGSDDKKRQADVESEMQSFCRIPIVNLWIPDLMDEETVFQKLRSELLG